MTATKSLWVASVVCTVSLAAGVALAQQVPPPPGGRMGPGRGAQVVSPLELERWFDSYVLLQAQETLRLTDAQFAPFLSRLKALQATRRRNLQARRQVLNAIGRLTNETPLDEAQMREQMKALRDLDARSGEELRRAYDALDEVLEIGQQGRFRVFEEVVERRKIDLLLRARQRAAGRGGAGPSPAR